MTVKALYYQKFKTPFSDLYIYADDSAIKALFFCPWKAQVATHAIQKNTPLIEQCFQQVDEYFAGERTQFNLPLAPEGTEFQQKVWQQLAKISFGETCSYGELAVKIGNKNASRAVGAANGKNPISIIIPCHRVIGANGSLTGYAGGLATKEWLLKHEGII